MSLVTNELIKGEKLSSHSISLEKMQIYKASSSSSVKFDHPFLISLISQLYVEEVEILGKFIIGVGQTFPINIQISLWRNLGRHKHWLKSIFNISQIN